jgi:hypothetical protein
MGPEASAFAGHVEGVREEKGKKFTATFHYGQVQDLHDATRRRSR